MGDVGRYRFLEVSVSSDSYRNEWEVIQSAGSEASGEHPCMKKLWGGGIVLCCAKRLCLMVSLLPIFMISLYLGL